MTSVTETGARRFSFSDRRAAALGLWLPNAQKLAPSPRVSDGRTADLGPPAVTLMLMVVRAASVSIDRAPELWRSECITRIWQKAAYLLIEDLNITIRG